MDYGTSFSLDLWILIIYILGKFAAQILVLLLFSCTYLCARKARYFTSSYYSDIRILKIFWVKNKKCLDLKDNCQIDVKSV